jgi:HSP20 family protein
MRQTQLNVAREAKCPFQRRVYRPEFRRLDVAILQNRLNSIFQDFSRPNNDAENLNSGSFAPAVDIYEDAQKLSLRIEVPGLKPEDVDIRVENNTMTVRGERRFANEEKEENYHRIERRYGSFVRSFTLPQTVDMENVSANYEQGLLSIDIPKKPEAKPKQVKIAVSSSSAPKQVEAASKVA